MKYWLNDIDILDKNSPFNEKRACILIEDGKIVSIQETINNPVIPSDCSIFDGKGCKVSVGWFDMRASCGEPGFEYRETLKSLSLAAQNGGFTSVAVLPDNLPIFQTKNNFSYYQNHSQALSIHIYPLAAITKDLEGKTLTEILDLHQAGVKAFSNGHKPIEDVTLLMRILDYLQMIDGLFIQKPYHTGLSQRGQMHEGMYSTLLGLKGIPNLSESMIVQRDLSLLEYAGGRLHFSLISNARSVEMIRKAKKAGLHVSCDVAAHQLVYTDEVMLQLDTNYKVLPPFRSQSDIDALIEGINDHTIDVIVSDHQPWDTESKNLEFDLAEFGIIALETAFANINSLQQFSLDTILDKLVYNPRALLKIQCPKINTGEEAELTIFDPNEEWIYLEENLQSLSKNSPFINQTFKGRVKATFNKGKLNLV